MHLLLAGFLFLAPIAPLNPMEQDTLPSMAIHVSAGLNGPNGIVTAGPTIASRLEFLVAHPFVVRLSAQGDLQKVRSAQYPDGDLWSMKFGFEGFYYRGTDRLMGYIGAGAVFAVHSFNPEDRVLDSLNSLYGYTDIGMDSRFGYRIFLGMRFKKHYSLEVAVTEESPDFTFTGTYEGNTTSRSRDGTRTSAFSVMLGMTFPILKH